MTPNADDLYCNTVRSHNDKNRSSEYLPRENIIYLMISLYVLIIYLKLRISSLHFVRHMVMFMHFFKCKVHCYLHIIFTVLSHRVIVKRKAFNIAQSPIKNTTRNFWKIILDYKMSAIAMLCELEENGEITYNKQTLFSLYNIRVLLSILVKF